MFSIGIMLAMLSSVFAEEINNKRASQVLKPDINVLLYIMLGLQICQIFWTIIEIIESYFE